VGSEDKVDWCKNELHFDHVFNYKKVTISNALSQVAPDGVDIYYDNVGGEFFHTIMNKHMRKFGRILTVGSIQTYNDIQPKSCKSF
jgi:NADPH-dependent curcumin reductase CurA